jgi:hypothetical protein
MEMDRVISMRRLKIYRVDRCEVLGLFGASKERRRAGNGAREKGSRGTEGGGHH